MQGNCVGGVCTTSRMLLDYTRPVTKKPPPPPPADNEVVEEAEEGEEDPLGEDVETPSSSSSSAAHCSRPNYTKVIVNVNYQTRYTF